MAPKERRRPRKLYKIGSEPDARFSLANERTFLAWIRTSLALVVSGVALVALGENANLSFTDVTGLLLILLGAISSLGGYFDWFSSEKALRLGRNLPGQLLGVFIAFSLTLLFLGGIAYEFFLR
ncbi:MAG: YidH family protein [Aquiluna sp.]